MKVAIEISAIGNNCVAGDNQCWYLTTSGYAVVCRAFRDSAKGKHCRTGHAVRLSREYGKYVRCAQCMENEVPNELSSPAAEGSPRGARG